MIRKNHFSPILDNTLSNLIDMLEVLISYSEKYQIEDRELKRKIDGLYIDILWSARKLDSSLDYPDTIFGNKDLVVKKKHQDIKIYDDNYRKSIQNFIKTVSELPIKSKNLFLIEVEIDTKAGVIKRLDNGNICKFRSHKNSNRFSFITKIAKGYSKGKSLAEKLPYLSKDIKIINERLSKDLNLVDKFIINDTKKQTGYHLNDNFYKVKLI
ncbi:MAG: hypothetical protein WCO35_03155 [Candidatus Nomurabacteria bacterium]